MAAENAIRALLMQASPVVTLVAARVYPGLLPIGCALAGLVVEHISAEPLLTIGAASGGTLMRAQVQVTILASSYTGQQALAAAVIAACNYQRGALAGLQVASVICMQTGPDVQDEERGVFQQSIEFQLTYQ